MKTIWKKDFSHIIVSRDNKYFFIFIAYSFKKMEILGADRSDSSKSS